MSGILWVHLWIVHKIKKGVLYERILSLYAVIPPRQGCVLPLRQQSRLRQSQTLRIVTKFRIRNVLDSDYDVKKEEEQTIKFKSCGVL